MRRTKTDPKFCKFSEILLSVIKLLVMTSQEGNCFRIIDTTLVVYCHAIMYLLAHIPSKHTMLSQHRSDIMSLRQLRSKVVMTLCVSWVCLNTITAPDKAYFSKDRLDRFLHTLWVFIRSTLLRCFLYKPTMCVFWKNKKK